MDRNRTFLVVGGSLALLASGLALRGFLKKYSGTAKLIEEATEAEKIAEQIEEVVKPKRKRKPAAARNGKTHTPA